MTTPGLIPLECDLLFNISPQETRRYPTLSIDVRMTKPQMRAAVEQFLGHITEAEWVEWVQELSPSVIASDNTRAAARQLRKALGISQDFDDWPLEKLMLKAAERVAAHSPAAIADEEG